MRITIDRKPFEYYNNSIVFQQRFVKGNKEFLVGLKPCLIDYEIFPSKAGCGGKTAKI